MQQIFTATTRNALMKKSISTLKPIPILLASTISPILLRQNNPSSSTSIQGHVSSSQPPAWQKPEELYITSLITFRTRTVPSYSWVIAEREHWVPAFAAE